MLHMCVSIIASTFSSLKYLSSPVEPLFLRSSKSLLLATSINTVIPSFFQFIFCSRLFALQMPQQFLSLFPPSLSFVNNAHSELLFVHRASKSFQPYVKAVHTCIFNKTITVFMKAQIIKNCLMNRILWLSGYEIIVVSVRHVKVRIGFNLL